jgi:molybdopterin/thiamine biosynthesis adenylyltransferase
MDKYDISNVNRQIFATTKTLGTFKAEVAAERIKEINPYCKIEMVICDRLTKDTATKLVKGADIVLMETDTTSSSLLLHKIAKKYKVPLINGHCYKVVKGKIHIFDYRNTRQRDFDEPTPFKRLNTFAQRFLKLTRKPFDEMSDKEIVQLDSNFTSYPAVNFTTNMVGCLVVAETIKFFKGDGSTCLHPKEIDIDLFKRKMRVSSAFSIRYSLDFIIRHWDQITHNLLYFIMKKF